MTHDELVRQLVAERHTNTWWHKITPVDNSDHPENQARRRAILAATKDDYPDRPALHVISDSRAA